MNIFPAGKFLVYYLCVALELSTYFWRWIETFKTCLALNHATADRESRKLNDLILLSTFEMIKRLSPVQVTLDVRSVECNNLILEEKNEKTIIAFVIRFHKMN